MQKIIILLLLVQSVSAIEVTCGADYKELLPTLDNGEQELVVALENRDFDPCEKIVEAPKSKEEMCSKDARFFQQLLCMKEGRMGFSNNKGLFGLPTGVCWWHSQFHRNANYLSYYNPDKPKIDTSTRAGKKELKKLINKIIKTKEIVEIPGYSNLKEFTEDPEVEKIVQKKLQGWMAKDSFLKMQWVNGLIVPDTYTKKSKEFYTQQNGWILNPFKEYDDPKIKERAIRKFERKTYKSEEKEKRKRDKTIAHQDGEVTELFDIVTNDQVGYITLQYPGVMAHAQIVFDAKKTMRDGIVEYEFKVQDSNYQTGNYDSQWSKKSYSQIKYRDGIWYMRASGSEIGKVNNYEPINIAVHKNNQLEKVNDIYIKECGKPLF